MSPRPAGNGLIVIDHVYRWALEPGMITADEPTARNP